jgi:DNA-binding GntR family transcriptional regulator
MNSPLRLERPQLLTDLAVERIREAIVSGELKLGEQVSEAQLAQSMGISKTPVREALLRLKIERLVEIHPQRGTFVFRLGPDEVGQMCRFRAMVETHALREAAAHDREELLRELQRCLDEMKEAEDAGDVARLSRIDMDFHRQFLMCCPNDYLQASYNLIRYQLIALRFRAPIENAIDSHQVLVDAIARGDIDGACELLQTHVLENELRYCRANDVA